MSQDVAMTDSAKRSKSQSKLTTMANKRPKSPSAAVQLNLDQQTSQLSPFLVEISDRPSSLSTAEANASVSNVVTSPMLIETGEFQVEVTQEDMTVLAQEKRVTMSDKVDSQGAASASSSHLLVFPSPNKGSSQGVLRNSPSTRDQIRHTRFQLVINLHKVQDGQYTAYVRAKLLKVLSDIKQFDNKVQLMAWAVNDRDSYQPIVDFSNMSPLPSVLTHLSKYINAYRIPRAQQKKEIWSKICLSHTCSTEDLLDNVQEILQMDQWGMTMCRLQVEKSKTIGWLLYSCKHFQEDPRLVAIYSALFQHDIALYWRKISGFQSNNNSQHALHVEVETCFASAAVSFFAALYGPHSTKRSWPLGIKMNLIPEWSNLPDGQLQQCRNLCFRQSLFVQELQTATMFHLVASHDAIISEHTKMDIRSALSSSTLPFSTLLVFHSMTVNKKGETLLTFFKYSQAYARMIVSSPLTFLKFYYDPVLVEQCFSEDERGKSANESMDPTTLEVVTAEAKLMEQAILDDGYGGLLSADIMVLANTTQQNSQVQVVNIPPHLKSYNRSSNNSTRSVDFRLQDYQVTQDNLSVQSDMESTLGDSKTPSQSYIRDIQAITAQVIAHFTHGGNYSTTPVPSPAATSSTTSVRFMGGPASGQGR